MNPLLAFILGGFLFGGNKTTVIMPPKAQQKVGKCNACPEYGLFREELGFFADDFCYRMYLQAKLK